MGKNEVCNSNCSYRKNSKEHEWGKKLLNTQRSQYKKKLKIQVKFAKKVNNRMYQNRYILNRITQYRI